MRVKLTQEQTAANIAKVVELRQQGLSRAAILEATGFPERFVRTHMKDVAVVTKAITTQFDTAVSRVYPLAVRPQGIKDYELRNICFEVYGSKFDEQKGKHVPNYSKDNLYRIKERCKVLAVGTTSVPMFVMDWVCDEAPSASRVALETLALELEELIQEKVNTFMELYATGYDDNQTESSEAQRKQQYAARRHILKLAIKEYSPEHTAVLLERSLGLTDALDSANDTELPAVVQRTTQRSVEPHTATDGMDAFLDAVEQAEQDILKNVVSTIVVKKAAVAIDTKPTIAVESIPQITEEFDDMFNHVADYNPDSLGGFNANFSTVCQDNTGIHA